MGLNSWADLWSIAVVDDFRVLLVLAFEFLKIERLQQPSTTWQVKSDQ